MIVVFAIVLAASTLAVAWGVCAWAQRRRDRRDAELRDRLDAMRARYTR